ncbi:hypothetical protein GCM10027063_32740 [Promicromonospora xylanilytica]
MRLFMGRTVAALGRWLGMERFRSWIRDRFVFDGHFQPRNERTHLHRWVSVQVGRGGASGTRTRNPLLVERVSTLAHKAVLSGLGLPW